MLYGTTCRICTAVSLNKLCFNFYRSSSYLGRVQTKLLKMGFGNLTSGAFHFSSIFFFVILAAASDDVCAQVPSCRPGGPAIKFPFWLQDKQPEHCGYPGFNLYCDNTSHTVLELPSSLRLLVESINYESHLIQISSPEGCLFLKQVLNLNIPNVSPFQISSWDRFTLFNCSLANNRSGYWNTYEGFDIDCLDNPGYKVHATRSQNDIADLPNLELCTKLYTTWASEEMFGRDNRIQLSWSLVHCEKCEKNGGICRMKNGTKDEIDCSVNRKSDKKKKRLITAGEVIGPLILLVAIIAAYYFYSSKKMYRENQVRVKQFLEDYTAMKPTRYSYQDLKRITNDFKEQLGEGVHGTVFKGKISDEILVAVKLLHDSTRKGEDFVKEVATMGRIHHVNVVRLIGFCADGFRRALIYEFLPKGSLDKFILSRSEQHNELGWDKMHDIALGIARGIEYLHQGCDQRILHFDIKPHNILLDDNFNSKISDFGLAKLFDKGKSAVSMTAARGTIGYMAPEVYYRQFGNVSYKSDIYSFGMLLLEMVGRRKNIDQRLQNVSQVNFPEWIYRNLVNGEDLGNQVERGEGDEIARKLAVVGLWCVRWNPVDRPSITFVLQMLEGNGENLNLPPNPTNSTVHGRALDSALEVISESE